MTGRYTIPMEKISSFITRHSGPIEAERPLIPVPTANYTGIIIIADEQLPVRGRRALALMEPCLFPKIWDTDMNLVFERNMIASNLMVRYAVRESIFRPTPSGLEGELAAFAGPNPLRILAREVFGVTPTDPVIDREDALKILSAAEMVSFGTVGEDGGPDIRSLSPVRADGLAEVWFATAADSPKVRQLKANPKAVVYGFVMDDFDEFRLYGEAEVLTDSASRRRAWRDDFAMHWEGPDSPNMVAMRFRAKRGQWAAIGKLGSFTV